MDRFPSDVADLLNARGRRLLADAPQLEKLIAARRTPIVVLDGIIDDGVARDCIRLLDEALYPHLRRMHREVSREALVEMTENYEEALPKTVRVKTATFNTRKSKVLDAAREIGLAEMMASKSMLRLVQSVSKPKLRSNDWGRQVICYETGGYSGPHNDHHPQNEDERNGFVDFHLMFSNEHVAQQLLVYEERRFLSSVRDVSGRSGLAIYRLPFWHYTTPLTARPGREDSARRWLLLASFAYDPPLAKLEY
jgi:hypothetical protein